MTLMDRARVDGAGIAYLDRGRGEAMVLLHPGFVADGMLPLLREPALGGYRLVAYHRRGYGASDPTGPRTMAEQAADALGLLDTLDIGRAHLVGHSFGANVAIEVALTAPDRVATLTLMEPLLNILLAPATAAYVSDTAQVALPQFLSGDPAGALETWLTAAFGPGFRDVLERALPGSWPVAVRDAGTAFGVELPALQDWPLDRAGLARIAAPTLSLVHTGDSWPGFVEAHEGLLATVPGSAAATVAISSHLLQIAAPAAVAAPVAAFAAAHPVPIG